MSVAISVDAFVVGVAVIPGGFLSLHADGVLDALIVATAGAHSAVRVSEARLYALTWIQTFVRVVRTTSRSAFVPEIAGVIYFLHANCAHLAFHAFTLGAAVSSARTIRVRGTISDLTINQVE